MVFVVFSHFVFVCRPVKMIQEENKKWKWQESGWVDWTLVRIFFSFKRKKRNRRKKYRNEAKQYTKIFIRSAQTIFFHWLYSIRHTNVCVYFYICGHGYNFDFRIWKKKEKEQKRWFQVAREINAKYCLYIWLRTILSSYCSSVCFFFFLCQLSTSIAEVFFRLLL